MCEGVVRVVVAVVVVVGGVKRQNRVLVRGALSV